MYCNPREGLLVAVQRTVANVASSSVSFMLKIDVCRTIIERHEVKLRAGLIAKMGEDWIHPSVHSAVQHCCRHRERKHVSETFGKSDGAVDATASTSSVCVSVVTEK